MSETTKNKAADTNDACHLSLYDVEYSVKRSINKCINLKVYCKLSRGYQILQYFKGRLSILALI